jgi:hypothetical protein
MKIKLKGKNLQIETTKGIFSRNFENEKQAQLVADQFKKNNSPESIAFLVSKFHLV